MTDVPQNVDPRGLIAALERAGWTWSGGRPDGPGAYVRMRWPDAIWNRDASLTIPLDPNAGDYCDLLQATVAELTLAVKRGRLAGLVLADSIPGDISGIVALAIRSAGTRWRSGSDEEYYRGLADAAIAAMQEASLT